MNLNLRRGILSGLCLAGFLAAGCSVLMPAPPTPTPEPTSTPTAAPTTPPTVTPAPTKSNVAPPAVAFALNKTQLARTMQFEFESAITLLQEGKTTKVPGLSLTGQDSTLNRHVTISGTTGDTNEFITYELIVLEEDVYLKGLTGMPGIDPAQWYILPGDIQAGIRRLPTARGLLASFNPADVGSAQFQAAGSEVIDDQTCSIWTAQHSPSAQNLLGVTADSQLKEQLGDIDSAEFKMWTCADGFIHLMTGQVNGHDPENQENRSTVTLRFRLSELDEPLAIEPPTGAKPFPSAPTAPTPASPNATPDTPAPGPTDATPVATDPTPAAADTTPTGAAVTPEATLEAQPSPTP